MQPSEENPFINLPAPATYSQSDTPSTTPQQQGLLIQEMAARIVASRRSFPHLSSNPLSGNSLY